MRRALILLCFVLATGVPPLAAQPPAPAGESGAPAPGPVPPGGPAPVRPPARRPLPGTFRSEAPATPLLRPGAADLIALRERIGLRPEQVQALESLEQSRQRSLRDLRAEHARRSSELEALLAPGPGPEAEAAWEAKLREVVEAESKIQALNLGSRREARRILDDAQWGAFVRIQSERRAGPGAAPPPVQSSPAPPSSPDPAPAPGAGGPS